MKIYCISYFAEKYGYSKNGIRQVIAENGIEVHRAMTNEDLRPTKSHKKRGIFFLLENEKNKLEKILEKKV